MKRIILNDAEINLLIKITTYLKMDWFDIDDKGRVRDRDNHNRVMSTRTAIKTIWEGVTDDSLRELSHTDWYILANLFIKL